MSYMDPPRDNRAVVALKDTERSLLDAASRLVAARIAAGEIRGEVSAEDMKSAILTAIRMGRTIDRMVHAEGEL